MKYASICVLAYKRPHLLPRCLESLRTTSDLPYQLIVNLDAGDDANIDYLVREFRNGNISNLIINAGSNRGVGRSFQNCLGVAEGDYIFKVDTDLIFQSYWLSRAVKVLDSNPDVGAVSVFDYNHYDPNDTRFTPSLNHLEVREDCIIVKDFVSSIYGFRKTNLLDNIEYSIKIPIMPDDGFHQTLGKMAITKEDYVRNEGFGVYKSTYVSGTEEAPFKTPTSDKPLIFKSGLSFGDDQPHT